MKSFMTGFFNGFLVAASASIAVSFVTKHKAPWQMIAFYWIGVGSYNLWKWVSEE